MADLSSSSISLSSNEVTAELTEISVNPAEAYERGKTDINFFAQVAMPNVAVFDWPAFYIAIWQILVSRDEKDIGKILRFALGLPRGHAKTTFIKLVTVWLIVYDKVTFALLLCANEPLAEQLVADVNDMLGSPNIEAIYGAWTSVLTTDTKELKKAWYHNRPVIIAAKGAGSSLRGLNIKHARPDFIFCDDLQTRENDESPAESARLLRWIVATMLKVIAPRGNRLIVYVGNMYSEECILMKLKNNPGWISFVTGAILSSGKPLWPELHSLDELMESYYHDEALGLADLWFAEVMNDPKSTATSLLSSPLPDVFPDKEKQPDGVFITIDPAGFRDISDDNVIVLHEVIDGIGVIRKTVAGILNPEELIRETMSIALASGTSLIAVEDTGYQQTLQFWIEFFMKEYRITGIAVVPINAHGRTKETRIRQFIYELLLGNYCFGDHDERAKFVWQASQYKVGKKKNKDDLLDACAYGLDVRNEYWELVTNLKTLGKTAVQARVVFNNTPF